MQFDKVSKELHKARGNLVKEKSKYNFLVNDPHKLINHNENLIIISKDKSTKSINISVGKAMKKNKICLFGKGLKNNNFKELCKMIEENFCLDEYAFFDPAEEVEEGVNGNLEEEDGSQEEYGNLEEEDGSQEEAEANGNSEEA